MRLMIAKEEENIKTFTDFTDAEDRGEIAHFICQLELIKNKLLKLWDEFGDTETIEVDSET